MFYAFSRPDTGPGQALALRGDRAVDIHHRKTRLLWRREPRRHATSAPQASGEALRRSVLGGSKPPDRAISERVDTPFRSSSPRKRDRRHICEAGSPRARGRRRGDEEATSTIQGSAFYLRTPCITGGTPDTQAVMFPTRRVTYHPHGSIMGTIAFENSMLKWVDEVVNDEIFISCGQHRRKARATVGCSLSGANRLRTSRLPMWQSSPEE